jgi:hypothetical protein
MFYIIVGLWIMICIVKSLLDPKNRLMLKDTFKH